MSAIRVVVLGAGVAGHTCASFLRTNAVSLMLISALPRLPLERLQ